MTTKGRKKVKFIVELHSGYEEGDIIDAYIYKKGRWGRAVLLIPPKEFDQCYCLVVADDHRLGNVWKAINPSVFVNL